ncbi:MAG: hypothetical protein R3D45_14930 [Rhizobiaceae bacterium]
METPEPNDAGASHPGFSSNAQAGLVRDIGTANPSQSAHAADRALRKIPVFEIL